MISGKRSSNSTIAKRSRPSAKLLRKSDFQGDNGSSTTSRPIRVIALDIETAPNLSYVWGRYEQDVIQNVRDWYIIGFAYKEVGTDKLYSYYVDKKDPANDENVAAELWSVLNYADVVVAHHGDRFDIPKIQARIIKHGFPPPSPFKQIDTKKVAKKYFQFDSNHLNDLGVHLGLGEKMSTGGFSTWIGCMNGDSKALTKMRKYNEQDVILLEKLYLKFRPWITAHPNHNVFSLENGCPNCGGNHVQRRGFSVTNTGRKPRIHCQDCGAWSHEASEKVTDIR